MNQPIANLAAALVAAQADLKNPKFDAKNPHFKSAYASLVSVREAVLPVLAKHGLTVVQLPQTASEGERLFAGCTNILMHSSGESIKSDCLLPLDKPNAHGAGSCITYARRYSLMAIAGVVGDEDDDANAAVTTLAKKDTATALAAAKVTPVAGSLDALSPDAQKRAKAIANSVVDLWNEGKEFAAYEQVYQAGYDNDFILGLWEVLGPFPTIRNKLKKMDKESQLAQTA